MPSVTSADGGPTRICAGCGDPFRARLRGRPGKYCRPACRQRAWALRRAEAELLEEGLLIVEPPAPGDGPVGLPAPVGGPDAGAGGPVAPVDVAGGPVGAAPEGIRGWIELLGRLERQLGDPGSEVVRRPWEHERLYDALGRALSALDAATPGGLDWLDRHG